jgi:tetratricopeptide (TPR) repeat protein
LADYDKVMAMGVSNDSLFNNRGLVMVALDRAEEAFIDYEKALSIKEDADTFTNKADLLVVLKRYEEALISLDKSLVISSDNPQSLKLRGAVYYQMKRFDDAMKDINKALELDENDIYFAQS